MLNADVAGVRGQLARPRRTCALADPRYGRRAAICGSRTERRRPDGQRLSSGLRPPRRACSPAGSPAPSRPTTCWPRLGLVLARRRAARPGAAPRCRACRVPAAWSCVAPSQRRAGLRRLRPQARCAGQRCSRRCARIPTDRLVVVFGCGGDRDRGKRPLMGEIAARLADRIIVTDDNPRSEDPAAIRAAVLAGCPGGAEIGDRARAIRRAVANARSAAMCWWSPARATRQGQIVGDATVIRFDDAVRSAAPSVGGRAMSAALDRRRSRRRHRRDACTGSGLSDGSRRLDRQPRTSRPASCSSRSRARLRRARLPRRGAARRGAAAAVVPSPARRTLARRCASCCGRGHACRRCTGSAAARVRASARRSRAVTGSVGKTGDARRRSRDDLNR